MDVYLIPIGPREYGLYAEPPEGTGEPDAPARRGLTGRLARRASAFAATIERDGVAAAGDPGWRARARRWAARQVREQRLLWQLRREQTVTIVAPDDCPDGMAIETVRRLLERDASRHLRWLAVDSVGFVGSGVFMLIPGPNLVAYYFALSLVGHALSLQGARHAREHVAWEVRPDPALAELRHAIGASPDERDRRAHAVAERLHLPNLPGFFARAAAKHA